MSKPKMYTNVKIPEELAREIDGILREGSLGYRSRGEFVADACRSRLIEIKKIKGA